MLQILTEVLSQKRIGPVKSTNAAHETPLELSFQYGIYNGFGIIPNI
jgi:hypothetical protein